MKTVDFYQKYNNINIVNLTGIEKLIYPLIHEQDINLYKSATLLIADLLKIKSEWTTDETEKCVHMIELTMAASSFWWKKYQLLIDYNHQLASWACAIDVIRLLLETILSEAVVPKKLISIQRGFRHYHKKLCTINMVAGCLFYKDNQTKLINHYYEIIDTFFLY